VAEVVQQRRGEGGEGDLVVDAVVRRQLGGEGAHAVEVALHDVRRAEGVGEARVLAAGEGERGQTEGRGCGAAAGPPDTPAAGRSTVRRRR
jgi:hypothetical protein